MPQRVLIVQSDGPTAQALAKHFSDRGDQVWQTTDADRGISLLDETSPQLILVDLHLPGVGWLNLLRRIRRLSPSVPVIITNKYPDFQRELLAKEQGFLVFLREPFTQQWIEAALLRLKQERSNGKHKPGRGERRPGVRVPMRVKITLPYAILALLFALVGGYVVTQVIVESVEERFINQLIEAGKQNADSMVQEEMRLLETLRLVANTEGVSGAIVSGDSERLHEIILALAANTQEEAVEILDTQGTSVLSLRHVSGGNVEDYTSQRGDNIFSQWDFVQYVLQGRTDQGLDKSAGMVRVSWGDYFYVSGPIFDPTGNLTGVILVGKSLPSLVRQIREDTLAKTTLYSFDGLPIVSALTEVEYEELPLEAGLANEVLNRQNDGSQMRNLQLASNSYSEILNAWEARGGEDLGIMGVALPESYVARPNTVTRIQIFVLVSVAFLLVVVVGLLIANQITRPLLRMVQASTEVARGNLEVKVETKGDDELAVLAHSFNYMVAGLQEGSIYRDLLGRTVSPEVREQLRQTFTSGNVRLEGQEAVATVLMSDIRGFTSLCENADPATVFNWLNEYFGDLVPIITANNGVVNKFDGDAMLAFFGILPRVLSPKESAYFACRAAVDMLATIQRLNIQRVERGEAPLATGIGINTGLVTAGGVGTSDRLHYTIIGDTVNTTQRVEGLTRDLFNLGGAVISQSTFDALEEHRSEFRLDPLGSYAVKGKSDHLMIYRLSQDVRISQVSLEEMIA